ncbi:MAG: hypothetical protein M3169_07490 [Candidatus Eremiobacteraeota bacterium]|nr:hypothetical protein [Candidatus Eremiobacteraeota bacterium]
MMALAGCGGGGGASTAPAQNPPPVVPTNAPSSSYVTPTFTIVTGTTSSSTNRNPKYISAGALSVKITLTNPPSGMAPAATTKMTDINGASGNNCATGCTVPGPASPPGNDTYTVTTYSATGAGGSALATATKTFAIAAGSPNTGLAIVLHGIVASVTLTGTPSTGNANTPIGSTPLTVNVKDASNNSIVGNGTLNNGQYADSTGADNNITVTVNETDPNGVTLVAGGSTPGATQNSQYSVTLHNSTDTVAFVYGGLAENVKTVTAAAATGGFTSSQNFTPALNAITPSSGTQIDLYVPSDVGGTGSSGSQTFSELGYTNSPYNKDFSFTFTPTSGFSTPCNQIATITQPSHGVMTATAPAASKPPAAGKCDLVINDNLTTAGHTATATTVVTYTTSSVSASSKHRKN